MKKQLFTLLALVMTIGMQAQTIHIIRKTASKTDTITYVNNAEYTYKAVLTQDEKIPVNRITLDKSKLTFYKGKTETYNLTATLLPDYATDKTVTWTSNPDSVATVNNGLVTGLKLGKTTITATANNGKGPTATCEVRVCDYGFSVSNTKTVLFTKGNLYWNGTEFHLRANQTDVAPSTSRDTLNVDRLFWTSKRDYDSGVSAYMPYRLTFKYSTSATTDVLWCGEENKITVDKIPNLYVLTYTEWNYLLNGRYDAGSLYKTGVTVTDDDNNEHPGCLIIAPDYFNETLKLSYTLKEINDLGLVCLPYGYYYRGSGDGYTTMSEYWSNTLSSTAYAYGLNSAKASLSTRCTYDGNFIRLVYTLKE